MPNMENLCPSVKPQSSPSWESGLQETLRRWDSQASGGTDGWRRVEWKQFTPDMLEHLAELHTCIEEKAVALSWEELSLVDAWPKDALFAPVATIPKDDNGQPGPLDLRPITVTSLLYASWASTRFRDLREWIARWVDESVIGGREGKQVQEAVWPLILELESAAESDIPVSAAAFDASKFFDHMEWDTTFGILRELNPMANHVFRLQRFFKQGQSRGPLWRASNGLIQGCSLTLVAAMAIATVWANFVRASTPEATLAEVIDDRRMFVSGPRSVEQLERVVKRTCEYDADTGTVTILKKTSCATRRPRDKEAMKKVSQELGIRHASIETQVCYQVAFQKKRPRDVKGMYPAPHIHEHFTIHKWLRQTAYIFTHNLNNLEHIANNCMSAMTHTDVTTAHH